ncbi:MAG: SAF domain-containing protein, partial [Deltaproteobacteria bacterium]
VDSAFSLEPAELAQLVIEAKRAWQAIGRVTYGPTRAEERAVMRRRSVYVTEDLKAGEILTKANLRCIRPGYGLAPRHYESLLGKTVRSDVKKGTPMRWDLIL